METYPKKTEKFSQSTTAKAIIIGVLTLLMLIPAGMIQSLIRERQERSIETINKINENWSLSQTLVGPIITIPYKYTYVENKKIFTEKHYLQIAPKELNISGNLSPEEKHYGIYKSILYQSKIKINGSFEKIKTDGIQMTEMLWNEAYISIGISDLRGIKNNIVLNFNNKKFEAEAGGDKNSEIQQGLVIRPNDGSIFQTNDDIKFSCDLDLNGSSDINFIPLGKTTNVNLTGNWSSPSFYGSFSPVHKITNKNFEANWKVLHFNRNIPQIWTDRNVDNLNNYSFGVNLINPVDHYQQNMRSAKYALMFIVLTFVVFFFVELFTKKKIHPIQYLLVGIALILFYSLLLSISEQVGFGIAYVIASFATIALISSYAWSIFKNKTQTLTLFGILSILYTFLYVILQLEDIALLIGSIGLFIVLCVIMYASKKINWYKQEENETAE